LVGSEPDVPARGGLGARAQRAVDAGYRVRVMEVQDAVRVAEVHVRTWQQAYAALMPTDYLAGLELGRFTASWGERLAERPSPEVKHLVGVHPSGDVVGIASAGATRDEDTPARLELFQINVLASEHGSGLADLMMTELVGDRPASLWVLEGNERARGFYTRHGFRPDGASKQHHPTGAIEVRLVRGQAPTGMMGG
jgi:ribosomal protein S18 acetylase RimI-like enzyme